MDTSKFQNRRSFIGTAAALGTVVAAGTASAATKSINKRQIDPDFFRVGALNVVGYSHLNGLWGPVMNSRKGQKDTPLSPMRITHCWDPDPDDSKAFAETYGCEPVKNFDDMVGKVDGIISGGYYCHPWNHIIHEPYLEEGLPNLVNRPFANSLAKTKKMIETAKKGGATIICPSAMELNEAIYRAKAWATGKQILCYGATNSFDDYPTHGVHGVYLMCKAICEAGNQVKAVAYRTDKWDDPPGILIYEHTDKDGRQFFGSLNQVSGSWGTINIHTPESYGGESFRIRTGTGFPFNKTEVWATPIWAFHNMALHGEMPQTFEQIYHKTQVFLAGWKSVLENGGFVELEGFPEDWESPYILPKSAGDKTPKQLKQLFG